MVVWPSGHLGTSSRFMIGELRRLSAANVAPRSIVRAIRHKVPPRMRRHTSSPNRSTIQISGGCNRAQRDHGANYFHERLSAVTSGFCGRGNQWQHSTRRMS
jgi:hypothetical protein